MQGFAPDFLANLVAELTAKLLEVAGRGAKETLVGDEAQQALRRCVRAGVFALLARATTDALEESQLLEDLFTAFFEDLFVARELSKLLRGRFVDREELLDLFEQVGYEAATLPGLVFE